MVKFLENAGLILTSKFEVFWGFILKKPRFLPCNKPHDFHPQPQRCCPHPHLSFWGFLRVNLKWKFSRILNKPRIFKLFLCYFIAFLVNFLRFFEDSSKMLISSSPQIVRIFEGRSSKTSNFLGHPQPQKDLENFENSNLNLKKTSNFEVRLRILVSWGLILPP